jgi:hypothetical protein
MIEIIFRCGAMTYKVFQSNVRVAIDKMIEKPLYNVGIMLLFDNLTLYPKHLDLIADNVAPLIPTVTWRRP